MEPQARDRARQALSARLIAKHRDGYVDRLEDNLVHGVTRDLFEPDFKDAAGNEMEQKTLAAYSSSALAVNTFAPWKNEPAALPLGCTTGSSIEFEAKCPTGLQGKPPHLDLLLQVQGGVLGVESKCLEYLDEHKLHMQDSYDKLLAANPELKRAANDTYRYLNVSQLIKHCLGLIRTYPEQSLTLLYLFWEPANWREFPVFSRHRAEVRQFGAEVEGGRVQFRALTYRQLWDDWSLRPGPAWLAEHVERLRERYDVAI